jgi:hypothetical protein
VYLATPAYCKLHVHGYKHVELKDESSVSYISLCVLRNYEYYIQGVSVKKVSNLGGDNIGHGEKELYTNVCIFLNCYPDADV